MDRAETMKFIQTLTHLYHCHYLYPSKDEMHNRCHEDKWYECLKDHSYELIMKILKFHLTDYTDYPPNPGDITRIINGLMCPLKGYEL